MKCPKCPNASKFTIEVVASCGKSVDLSEGIHGKTIQDEMFEQLLESLTDSYTIKIGPTVQCEECGHHGVLVEFGDLPDALDNIPLFQIGVDE